MNKFQISENLSFWIIRNGIQGLERWGKEHDNPNLESIPYLNRINMDTYYYIVTSILLPSYL